MIAPYTKFALSSTFKYATFLNLVPRAFAGLAQVTHSFLACARLSGRIKTSKAKIRRARLGKGDGGDGGDGGGGGDGGIPRAFFAFLVTERLFTTILEPGTG